MNGFPEKYAMSWSPVNVFEAHSGVDEPTL
jgi:hypothetical protein